MILGGKIGVVAIGRNEGQRLGACLRSCAGKVAAVVYVDSGSTDGSIELAKSMGVEIVALDLTKPFTAARARNAGYARLIASTPAIEYVQFVDGDCEIVAGWMEHAASALASDPKLAVACGRRRERFPDASIYNRFCDIEWATPVGPARSCGGDAMIRLSALRQIGGYDAKVIAGEEPEMCVRLRGAGWTIARLDAEMTLHDAAMSRLSQWRRRNIRAGHAAAEGAAMHGKPPERHQIKAVRSNWVWGAIVPAVIAAGAIGAIAWPPAAWAGVLILGYPVLALRVYRNASKHHEPKHAALYAAFVTLGKFPQALGQLKYVFGRISGRRSGVIEYRGAASSGARAAGAQAS